MGRLCWWASRAEFCPGWLSGDELLDVRNRGAQRLQGTVVEMRRHMELEEPMLRNMFHHEPAALLQQVGRATHTNGRRGVIVVSRVFWPRVLRRQMLQQITEIFAMAR